MKILLIILLIYSISNSSLLFSQITLTLEGTLVNNTDTGTWGGVNIARNVPTVFTYRNNAISSQNTSGYMLQAGDEMAGKTNNNLNGQIITGNKFIWNGIVQGEGPSTHGLFTGYNINSVLKYNYLDNVPSGIQMKSNGMTNTSGGVAYDVFRNIGIVAIPVKGMKNVNIFNNTFYSNQVFYQNPSLGVWRGLIDIYANTDEGQDPSISCSSGTKIKNNIFYTAHQIYNIAIYDTYCLEGFESDYNVFYCESGTPIFNYLGTLKTFAQWQALGYDKHSIVANPNFNDFKNLAPKNGLYFGTNLGAEYQSGLANKAEWVAGYSPVIAEQANIWQAGAIISETIASNPVYIGSVVENTTPDVLKMTFNTNLANIVPAVSAFNVQVNSVARSVDSVTISGSSVLLSLANPIVYGDTVTVAYSKPTDNPIQKESGDQAPSITAQPVINNCVRQITSVLITSPVNGTEFTEPAAISITADISGNNGLISMLEVFNGNEKLGEMKEPPYTFTWTNVNSGAYHLTVLAIDNSNAIASSDPVDIYVNTHNDPNNEVVNLYPNPNSGNFTIALITPFRNESNRISISNSSGVQVFEGNLQKEELSKKFDLSHINSGIYVLMIVGKEILICPSLRSREGVGVSSCNHMIDI